MFKWCLPRGLVQHGTHNHPLTPTRCAPSRTSDSSFDHRAVYPVTNNNKHQHRHQHLMPARRGRQGHAGRGARRGGGGVCEEVLAVLGYLGIRGPRLGALVGLVAAVRFCTKSDCTNNMFHTCRSVLALRRQGLASDPQVLVPSRRLRLKTSHSRAQSGRSDIAYMQFTHLSTEPSRTHTHTHTHTQTHTYVRTHTRSSHTHTSSPLCDAR